MLSTIINLVRFCQISDIANENRKLPFQITLDIQMKISPLSQNPLEIKRIEPLSGCFFARLFDYSIEMRPRESRIRKYSFSVFSEENETVYTQRLVLFTRVSSVAITHAQGTAKYTQGKEWTKRGLNITDILLFFLSWLCNRKFSSPVELFDDEGNKHNKAKNSVLIETSGDLQGASPVQVLLQRGILSGRPCHAM